MLQTMTSFFMTSSARPDDIDATGRRDKMSLIGRRLLIVVTRAFIAACRPVGLLR
jgi:hypothetical protein